MFHALMGRFQLQLFIFITYFSTVAPLTSCVFFPVGRCLSGYLPYPSQSSRVNHPDYIRKAFRKKYTTIKWDNGRKIDNKNK